MRMKYRISNVYHSGRKCVRYDLDRAKINLQGSVFVIENHDNIESVKQFEPLHFSFVETMSPYEFWDTTEVIGLRKSFNDAYELETINSIYIIKEIHDGGKE